MEKRTTIFLIAFCLLLFGVVQLIVAYSTQTSSFGQIGQTGLFIAYVLGLNLMVNESKLIRTVYGKVIIGLLLGGFFGSFFKVMHWPMANAIMLFSYGAVAMTYCVRFWNKPVKGIVDVLKLIWVLVFYVCAMLVMMHWVPEWYSAIPQVLFWVVFVAWLVVTRGWEKPGTTSGEDPFSEEP